MTLHDLLKEAAQLSLKEQIQLATQLLQLVDQQIAIAADLEDSNATNLDIEVGSIGYLLAHPIAVKKFQPLSRNEIYDRS
jgi:hypothetical protein